MGFFLGLFRFSSLAGKILVAGMSHVRLASEKGAVDFKDAGDVTFNAHQVRKRNKKNRK